MLLRRRILTPIIVVSLLSPVPFIFAGQEEGKSDSDLLIEQAQSAREAGNLGEAVRLYRQVLVERDLWAEGWWYLATMLYDLNRYDEAVMAFRRFVGLEPENGPGWALLGLNEYQIREYDRALESLRKALSLGLGNHEQMVYVSNYHAALLLNRFQEYEAAIEILNKICQRHSENPKIIEALGISVLRMPFVPQEVPPDRREAVMLAGRAASYWSVNRLDDAAQSFLQLGERYPNLPNVHYTLGVFALQNDPTRALEEFKKELEFSPDHVPARLQIVFEYLKRGEPESGLVFAEEGVEMDPNSFAARNALGRTLLELDQTDRAIEELEKGVELAPNSAQMHFALARAYTKAGRKEDAQRSRAEFRRLDDLLRDREEKQIPLIPGTGSERQEMDDGSS